jgi:uncharacterized membrane protein SirB2
MGYNSLVSPYNFVKEFNPFTFSFFYLLFNLFSNILLVSSIYLLVYGCDISKNFFSMWSFLTLFLYLLVIKLGAIAYDQNSKESRLKNNTFFIKMK